MLTRENERSVPIPWYGISDIKIDNNGNIWIVNNHSERKILSYAPDLSPRYLAHDVFSEIINPWSIAFLGSELLIGCADSEKVLRYANNGKYLGVLVGDVNPMRLGVDSEKNLYVFNYTGPSIDSLQIYPLNSDKTNKIEIYIPHIEDM